MRWIARVLAPAAKVALVIGVGDCERDAAAQQAPPCLVV